MGLQLKIGAEFSDIVKEANKAEDAIDGLQSSLSGLNKTINLGIDVKTNFDDVAKEIRQELDSLTTTATVGIDAKEFESRLKIISDKLASLTDAKLSVTADSTQAEAAINGIIADLARLKTTNVILRADGTQALGIIDTIENKLNSLTVSINPDEFKEQISVVQNQLNSLFAEVEINGDASNANLVIKDLQSKLTSLTDPSFDILANPTKAEVAIQEILTAVQKFKDEELFLRTDNSQALQNVLELEKSLQGIQATVVVDTSTIQSKAAEIKEAFGKLDFSVRINDSIVDDTVKHINDKLALLADPTIDVFANPEQVEATVNELRTLLASLKGPNVNLTANAEQAEGEINSLQAEINTLKGTNIVVRADSTKAEAIIDAFDARLQELKANVTVDTASLRDKAKEIIQSFGSLNFTANVEVKEGEINSVVKRINEKLALLSDPSIDFSANSSEAKAAISEINALLKTLKDSNVSLGVSGAEAVETFLADIQASLIKVQEVANITVTITDTDVKTKINDLKSQIDTISSSTKISADTTEFDAALKEVKAKVATIDTPDIDLEANKEQVELTIVEIVEDLKRLKGSTVVLDANGRPAIKSINELEKELVELEKQFKQSTNPKELQALGKAASLAREQIRGISTSGLQTSLKGVSRSGGEATQTLINLSRIAQDAPFGFIGIANNINPLVESFQRLQVASKQTGTSLLSNLGGALSGAGGIGLGIGVVSSLLVTFGDKLFASTKGVDSLSIALGTLNSDLDRIKDNIRSLDIDIEFKSAIGGLLADINIGSGSLESGLNKLQTDNILNTEKAFDLSKGIEEAQKISNRTFQIYQDNISDRGRAIVNSFTGQMKDLPEAVVAELSTSDQKLVNAVKQTDKELADLGKQKEDVQRKSVEFTNKIRLQQLLIQKKAAEDSKNLLEKQLADFEKFQNDVIAKARQFKREFGSAFVLPELDESFFVDKNQIFKRAQDVLSKVKLGGLKIQLPVQTEVKLVDDGFEEVFSEIFGKLLKVKKFKAVRIPIITESDFIETEGPGVAKDKIDELQQNFFDELKAAKQEPFVFDPSIQVAINNEKILADAAKRAESLADSMKQIFAQAFQSLGEDIGNAITGGGDIFKSIFQIIGSGVQALGKQIVALGVAALNLKKALATLLANPTLAIAAGVALTAIGTAMKNISSGGIKGFAEGGLVFGPTLGLVGEGFGTNRSNPEVIAPLDKLKGMLGAVGGQPTGNRMSRIRGRDIVLVTNRERRSQRR